MGWHTNLMPLPKNWTLNSAKMLSDTDSADLNRDSYSRYFIYFDRQSCQVQTEKKQRPFSVTKLNILHTVVLTYEPNNYG